MSAPNDTGIKPMTCARKRKSPSGDENVHPDSSETNGHKRQRTEKAEGKRDTMEQVVNPTMEDTEHNPYLDLWKRKMKEEKLHEMLNPTISKERRAELVEQLDMQWIEKYAWAIPSERALEAIKRVVGAQRVVELGCGAGYWGRLLLKKGVNWRGVDPVAQDGNLWAPVLPLFPGALPVDGIMYLAEKMKDEEFVLMLVYPDDYMRGDHEDDEDSNSVSEEGEEQDVGLDAPKDEEEEESPFSLAFQALDEFTGDTLIHVGELLGDTVLENPWGRTSSEEFQVMLMARFHKVLDIRLPSWPLSRDRLTVWKRHKMIDVEEQDFSFREIPSGHMPGDQAAPEFADLLEFCGPPEVADLL